MAYILRVVDADYSCELPFDRMHLLEGGAYERHLERLFQRCIPLFSDFLTPYLVFRKGLVRIQTPRLSPVVHFGDLTPLESVIGELEGKIFPWWGVASRSDVRDILNVSGNACDSLLEELSNKGYSIERKKLIEE